jgi:hypothetical protein
MRESLEARVTFDCADCNKIRRSSLVVVVVVVAVVAVDTTQFLSLFFSVVSELCPFVVVTVDGYRG